MKSFLAILGVLAVTATPGISLLTNSISDNSIDLQQEGNFSHYWNNRQENEVELKVWYVYDTAPSYQNIFLTEFNLTAETNNQLKTADQIADFDLTTNPDMIPPLGYPATFVTRTASAGYQEFLDKDENSAMKQIAKSSLAEKLSGNLGDQSEKALYDGAQYTLGTWDFVNADNVAMQAGIKFGLTTYQNEQSELILAVWGSLFVQSAPAEYWLGGLAFLPIGQSLQIDYKY